MKRSVSYVKLHTTLFVPHFGNVEATLPPKGKTMTDLKMVSNAAGIICSFKGPRDNKGLHPYSVFVPWGTVQSAVVGEEIIEDVIAKPAEEVKKPQTQVKKTTAATEKSEAAA